MKDLSVPMARMQLLAIPFLLASGLMAVGYGWVWGWDCLVHGFSQFFELIYFIPTLLLGIVVHEGLHGLGWKYAGNLRWGDMRFGVQWKSLTPYAHSTKPMQKKYYVIGSLLPGVLMGIIPYIVALILGYDWWVLFGIVFTFTAGGDFWTVYVLRNISPNAWVRDHPINAGCMVYDENPVVMNDE